MSRQPWIAEVLLDFGCAVVEVDGWRDRGSSDFNPRGVVAHHTAGPAGGGDMPSLNTLIHGRSDLPGPLCNVGLGRSGTYYIVAAGRANHAGSGGWNGLTGNSSVLGIEAENDGYQPWPVAQLDAYALGSAALLDAVGADVAMWCRHAEWAPGRKPDPHDIDGNQARQVIAAIGQPPPPISIPLGADVISRDAIELVEHAFATYPANPRPPVGDALEHYAGLIAQHEHDNNPKGAVSVYAALMRDLDAEP